MKANYENIALKYAETYGVIEYTVTGSKMIYYINYKEYAFPHYTRKNYRGETYKCVVNLRTLKEKRTLLKYYYAKGWNNR
jgi:hypothetical protein